MSSSKVKKMVIVAMMGSISYVLMLLDFPFPGLPVYLKIDFSDIPALITALIFGPMASVAVEAIKNLLNFAVQGSPTGVPIGHLANLAAGVLFVLPTYYVYRKLSAAKWGMTAGLAAGTIFMAVFMSILNYYVILPAYTMFAGWEAMSNVEMRKLVATAVLPFNIIKGAVITVVFMLLFARLQSWISRQSIYKNA